MNIVKSQLIFNKIIVLKCVVCWTLNYFNFKRMKIRI